MSYTWDHNVQDDTSGNGNTAEAQDWYALGKSYIEEDQSKCKTGSCIFMPWLGDNRRNGALRVKISHHFGVLQQINSRLLTLPYLQRCSVAWAELWEE